MKRLWKNLKESVFKLRRTAFDKDRIKKTANNKYDEYES